MLIVGYGLMLVFAICLICLVISHMESRGLDADFKTYELQQALKHIDSDQGHPANHLKRRALASDAAAEIVHHPSFSSSPFNPYNFRAMASIIDRTLEKWEKQHGA